MGTTASTTSGLESPRAAPGRLELVRQFINTADLHPGEDELVDLEALRAWLRKRGLIAPREPLAAGDLERALALREALRTLFAVRDRDGVPALEPVARGLEGAFAELLAIIEHAAVDGSLARLKVCADHDCRWAFYDQSKNRSRSWCNMAVCGNRAKAREYRRRHRSPAVSGGAKQ